MKLGTENKKKVVAAVALLVIAVALMTRTLWQRASEVPAGPALRVPSTTRAATTVKPATAREREVHHVAALLTPTLDPRLRLDLLKDSESVKYEGAGRNIFRERLEEIPKPQAPGLTDKKPGPPPPPPGPPPPPPINLKFYGWATAPGEAKAIFLAQGDNVFVAHEGDIIARRYKVLRISPNAVEIQDVLSNNTQSIPLTQG